MCRYVLPTRQVSRGGIGGLDIRPWPGFQMDILRFGSNGNLDHLLSNALRQ